MSSKHVNYNRPKDWQAFERLTCDLFSRIYNEGSFDRYGRNGQRQNGIDIIGEAGPGKLRVGVQCKGRQAYGANAVVTEKDILNGIKQAKSILPKLDKLIFVTTADNDAKTQSLAAEISEQHRAAGLFDVEFHAWGWFERYLSDFPIVAEQYGLIAVDTKWKRRVPFYVGGAVFIAIVSVIGIVDWRDNQRAAEYERYAADTQKKENEDQIRTALFNWDVAFSSFLSKLVVMKFPQDSNGVCKQGCSIWELRKFYGNETDAGVLDIFKADFEQIGSLGSELVGETALYPSPFDRRLFTKVIEDGRDLNATIDKSQDPGRTMSIGDRLGFVVNGSSETWVKFYNTVPDKYATYTRSIKELIAYYCKDFRPSISKQLDQNNSSSVSGDLSQYQDPCSLPIDSKPFVEGSPDFVLKRLSQAGW